MTAPIIIIHRRNRITQLADIPRGSWIEIDIDMYDGVACLSHDPATRAAAPEPLTHFLPRAVEMGVLGFVFDCKRENVEKSIRPLIAQHKLANYFYLNEMEIQADIFLMQDATHRTAMRIWKYRSARDVIRYAEDLKAANQAFPAWVWVDTWQRELSVDVSKPFLPLNQSDAHRLQKLGVRLCLCSPELYVHEYDKTYEPDDLENIYRSVVRFRERLMQTGVSVDAVCTKFPFLWTTDIDQLAKTSRLTAM